MSCVRLPMISSAPNLSEQQRCADRSDSGTMTNNSASTWQIKSAANLADRPKAQQSQQELQAMHRLVDQTDVDLRRALEHTAIRHEQLDQLQLRSQELLSKNENLVFGKIGQRATLSTPLLLYCLTRLRSTAPSLARVFAIRHETSIDDVLRGTPSAIARRLRRYLPHDASLVIFMIDFISLVLRASLVSLEEYPSALLSTKSSIRLGITNYRKTQERDLFWRRCRYGALGTVTLCLIILLIILSMISRRPSASAQIIDVRHSNAEPIQPERTSTIASLTPVSDKQRRLRRQILASVKRFLPFQSAAGSFFSSVQS